MSRAGPTKDHDVAWVYSRAALPVEVTAEFENWRRIRDWEGAEGWVYHSLLSGRRTALVSPQSKGKDELRRTARQARRGECGHGAAAARRARRGEALQERWCRVVGEGFDGWVEQTRLWGVYPDEKVE